jgi:hypothetical protein
MKTKHTLGPWHYGHSDPQADEPFYYIAEPEDQTEGPDINVACVSYSGNNYDPEHLEQDRAKAEANAKLIAAAPDLLRLLREIIYDSTAELCAEARALIEKVEGK